MKAITYQAPWLGGQIRDCVGYPTGVPGLLVGEAICCHDLDLDALLDDDNEEETSEAAPTVFTVVHHRSGCVTACGFDSPEAALAAARQLAPAADWTLPRGGLLRVPDLRFAVYEAAFDFDGHAAIGKQEPGSVDNGVLGEASRG
ncbi:hypothetical protein [Acrocarpospora sp. B8E8]|uniref:hypothetical protein n=1 Tax=Acrocarpospora sp. B8E8 TaxID=3153572 RepID=UPI00325C98F3